MKITILSALLLCACGAPFEASPGDGSPSEPPSHEASTREARDEAPSAVAPTLDAGANPTAPDAGGEACPATPEYYQRAQSELTKSSGPTWCPCPSTSCCYDGLVCVAK
jgi:hypothetical protein